MTQERSTFDSKLQEFRIWAMTLGRYSPSTVKRAVRRIRSFSRVMDLFNPNQEKLLNFFASEIEKGVKPHTINNQRKDLAAWFRFLNISIEMPKIREPPVPDPWIPSDEGNGLNECRLKAEQEKGDQPQEFHYCLPCILWRNQGRRTGADQCE